MRLICEKVKGKISSEYEKLIAMLEDGKYLITVRSLNESKTERDFQNEYFALVDEISCHTGDSRYSIHLTFKKHRDVSTTTNFDLQDWVNFIDALRWWAFNNLDLVL